MRPLARSLVVASLGLSVMSALAAAAVGACASFSSAGDTDLPATDGGDGSSDAAGEPGEMNVGDGAAEGAASDAADAADAANLLVNGTFTLGCDSWTGVHADLAQEPGLDGGPSSCRVCSNGAEAFAILQDVSRPVLPGETYRGEAFLRAPTGDASTATSLVEYIDIVNGGGMIVEQTISSGPKLDSTSQRIGTSLSVTADSGVTVRFEVLSNSPGTCFLIDSARLYLK